MTWILNLIPIQYRVLAAGIAIGMVFLSGWYAHTVWDGYRADKVAVAALESAKEGQTKLVKFNTDYAKEKARAKDACIDSPMPESIRLLLSGKK